MQEIHIRFTFNCSWQRIRFDVEIGLIGIKKVRINYPSKLLKDKTYMLSKMEFSPEDKNFYFNLTNILEEPPPFGPWADFLIEHTDLADNLIVTVEKADLGMIKLEVIENGVGNHVHFIKEPLSSPKSITIPLKKSTV